MVLYGGLSAVNCAACHAAPCVNESAKPQNSQLNSLLAGKCSEERGSLETASTATESIGFRLCNLSWERWPHLAGKSQSFERTENHSLPPLGLIWPIFSEGRIGRSLFSTDVGPRFAVPFE
jgi:hypothetical protein